jgi:(p)ppGpp synthase/HD superfamily hydrolase
LPLLSSASSIEIINIINWIDIASSPKIQVDEKGGVTMTTTTTGALETSPLLTERYDEALLFARHLHAGQFRKGTKIPYITHLLAVSALVLEDGGDEDEAIAALLHDGPEDQGAMQTLTEIRNCFGDRVAEIVDGCTEPLETPKPGWRERKETYLARIPMESQSVLRVACADKLHNVQAILRSYRQHGEGMWERFNSPREEQLWFYRSLAEAFLAYMPGPMADELARTVTALTAAVAEHDQTRKER